MSGTVRWMKKTNISARGIWRGRPANVVSPKIRDQRRRASQKKCKKMGWRRNSTQVLRFAQDHRLCREFVGRHASSTRNERHTGPPNLIGFGRPFIILTSSHSVYAVFSAARAGML